MLRPPLPPAAVPQLALVVGLAVADAVRAVDRARAALKWPNDVLIGGRKVAGILTELDAEVERVHHVIAGIGVNVNTVSFPPSWPPTPRRCGSPPGMPVDRARLHGPVARRAGGAL